MNNTINRLQEQLRTALGEIPEPEPPFDFRVGWYKTYDELFRGDVRAKTDKTDIDEIVSRALKHGRVMLHGRGGGAKSVVLWRLMRRSLGANFVSVWVDLKKWASSDDKAWADLEDSSQRLDFLLGRYAIPRVTTLLLDALPPGVDKVIFVDGLNELSSGTAHQFIDSVAEFPRRVPASGIVISDRLVRRDFSYPEDWQLATILPLEEPEIRAYLVQRFGSASLLDNGDASLISLLGTPYFLDAALRGGRVLSEAAFHAQYFSDHVSLSQEDLTLAAGAAFKAYHENQTRIFPLDRFSRDASPSVVEKLRQAGALYVEGDQAFFVHHLKHDYLVALYVAADPTRWTGEVFSTVTFNAASFDVLKMALELIGSPNDADLFVRRVYDWNQYGAAYAVADAQRTGRVRINPEMEIILLAVLAERRWDLISATVQRVTDALHLFGTERARSFLEAGSPVDVYRIVRGFAPGTGEFSKWSKIFTRSQDEGVTDTEIELILDEDSVIGWTFTNVLKRLRLTQSQRDKLRKLLPRASPASRWRIAHALGSFPSRENARALLEIVDHDDYMWARYGAIRSLVEMAALADPRLREFIGNSLEKRMATVSKDSRVLQEFAGAIFVQRSKAPENWAELVTRLIKALWNNETSMEKRDYWQKLAYRVRETYRSDS